MAIVICEAERITELEGDLRSLGVSGESRIVTVGGFAPADDIHYVGLPPCPTQDLMELAAPIEGAQQRPRWESSGSKSWYTRDLVAFLVAD